MKQKFKTLRVLNTFLRLYEQAPTSSSSTSQDATEPAGDPQLDDSDPPDELTDISSAEKTLIKILSKAFSYVPRESDKNIVQKLKEFLDNSSQLSMRQVIDTVKYRLPISSQDMVFEPNTSAETALTSEGEKYYANLIAKSFMYTPTNEEIKIVNGLDQQYGNDDPHQVSDTIETLLDVSVQDLESVLDNFPKQ
jgi:hypothetical protein